MDLAIAAIVVDSGAVLVAPIGPTSIRSTAWPLRIGAGASSAAPGLWQPRPPPGKSDVHDAEGADARGEAPALGPFSPDDVAATFYKTFGIDITKEYHTRSGRPVMIVRNGRAIEELV